MTSYVPVVKNGSGGAIIYVGLVSQVDTRLFQSSPTIAAGDFKVSLDGAALNNLGTLPSVSPAASKVVKITLSQAETNADNIIIVGSDAAGAEWCDIVVNIQTVARQIDNLAFPNTSGRGMDVDASGGVEVGSIVGDTGAANHLREFTDKLSTAGAIDTGTFAMLGGDVLDTGTIQTIADRVSAVASADTGMANYFAQTLLDKGVVDGRKVVEVMRLWTAVLGGTVHGAGSGTEYFAKTNDTGTPRITATVDNDGNRSAITYALDT